MTRILTAFLIFDADFVRYIFYILLMLAFLCGCAALQKNGIGIERRSHLVQSNSLVSLIAETTATW